MLGIRKRTFQEWEQGRGSPSGAAQALIRIAERHPEFVLGSLGVELMMNNAACQTIDTRPEPGLRP